MPSTTSTKSSRSGNPSKRAAAAAEDQGSRYAPSAWGSAAAYTDLTCPSGQLCQVRRPGLEGLMREGILNQLDVLTPLIEQHRDKVKGKKATKASDVDVSALLADPDKMANVLHLLDRVTVHCVVQPAIEMTPNDPTRRQPGVIYADMVDMEDKTFILNFALGGSSDLERFRVESAGAVGGVLAAEEDEDTAE